MSRSLLDGDVLLDVGCDCDTPALDLILRSGVGGCGGVAVLEEDVVADADVGVFLARACCA